MNFQCPHCDRGMSIDDRRWGGKRIRLKCPGCGTQHRIQVPPPPGPPGPASPDGNPVAAPRDEAVRIARLILQEIVLYNEKSLQRMTRKREVLTELRGDLVRAKRHFLSRIPEDLSNREEIFNQMVREILLAGKA